MAMRVKPQFRVGAAVVWSPRENGVKSEDYSRADIAMLASRDWSIWSRHPRANWVWLVGGGKSVAACMADLEAKL